MTQIDIIDRSSCSLPLSSN